MTESTRHSRRVVFFGDSICVGQGISLHKSWVARLAAYIDERLGPEFVVVNASINGSTTRQGLERMPYEVQSQGVAILIVQFGMNDCNYWGSDNGLPRVSEKAFAANLEEIIQRGLRFGARRILVNTNHPTTRDSEPVVSAAAITYEDSNRRYNTIIRDVASSMDDHVLLNDVERSFHDLTGGKREALARLLLDDGLHLALSGHDAYYRVILPKLESALAECF